MDERNKKDQYVYCEAKESGIHRLKDSAAFRS